MNEAEAIVKSLLEDEFDAHVKAHNKVKTWDNANSTFADLFRLRKKSLQLYGEMGRSLAYERALAHIGARKEDVKPIYADQIGSLHNYKKRLPAKKCTNPDCSNSGIGKFLAMAYTECPRCYGPLTTTTRPTVQKDLDRMGNWIVGVEMLDGKRIWFDEPVPPATHDWSSPEPEGAKPYQSSRVPAPGETVAKMIQSEDPDEKAPPTAGT